MAKISCRFLVILLHVVAVVDQSIAITVKNDRLVQPAGETARTLPNNGTPFRFNREASKINYEDIFSKYRVHEKTRDRLKLDRDGEALSAGQFENGFYGPAEETGAMHFQDFGHGTTYVSTVPFSTAPHGDKGAELPNGFQRPGYGLGHQGHAMTYPGHHVLHQHYGPDPHSLALKSLFLPLAGVALLGAAAALVSNPVLLQLGVISGKRKRRSTTEEIHDIPDIRSPFKNPK